MMWIKALDVIVDVDDRSCKSCYTKNVTAPTHKFSTLFPPKYIPLEVGISQQGHIMRVNTVAE